MPYADAMNKTLVFAIFDFDRFSKHDQIGEVKVPLCQIDLAQTIEEWRELQSVEGEGGQVISYSILYHRFIVWSLLHSDRWLHPVRTTGWFYGLILHFSNSWTKIIWCNGLMRIQFFVALKLLLPRFGLGPTYDSFDLVWRYRLLLWLHNIFFDLNVHFLSFGF